MSEKRPRGPVIKGWTPPPLPERRAMMGRYARLEPLGAEAHAALLFRAYDGHDEVWDYMPAGPFASSAQFHRWMRDITASPDYVFFAIYDTKAEAYGGFASYLRVQPSAGSIEVGYIAMAPRLQRTIAATEAMYLMMKWAFQAGYRRYEWKCDALNLPSRRAAERLGFSYEGVFRQATVVKGRNRDTAWFAAIDAEWPALDEAFRLWLDPSNFDAQDRQRSSLSDLTRLVRVASDPALRR
ncbi:Protein N-acetyltransferase, RimJ/RimL family [Roseovarius nanhaiticus]|uniref:Protein N-acetyltransferase, RimJ/RimL family n=1 Tax=Roseovarius nanhaiticus TaxID=573024 RepID=A0A1N7FZ90_9RHOB|nr:GNAT family protein [Roseovarius nanhaiticus]SEK41261.1 Protein N-acetyltransferase, RimJ/RimL family [Roseovarius nanhaiticus]SIS05641.1 Protein N-acetyltransferase, RimJ/RimL family [Roseovarius nanhaiticus]